MIRVPETRHDGYAKAVERLFDDGSAVGLTEGQLVERFVGRRDESAFAALVDRHGPMVLGVCRSLLRDAHDAEDAFQAVFLVLARKAGGLRDRTLVANWLYGVACRVASDVRRGRTAARRSLGADAATFDVDARRPADLAPADELAREEERIRLHEEVGRLPTRYRAAVVACYLEGRTNEEAAALLGCPVGTVKGRLSRARDLLRKRLGRDVSASAVAPASLFASDVLVAVPPDLAARAARTAVAATASPAAWMTTAALSTTVRTLAEGAIQAMTYSQIKSFAVPASFVALGLFAAGAGAVAAGHRESEPDAPPAASSALVAAPESEEPRAPAPVAAPRPAPVPAPAQAPAQAPTPVPAQAPAPDSAPASRPGGGGFGGGFDGGFDGIPPGELRLKIAGLAASVAKLQEDPQSRQVHDALAQPFTLRSDEDLTLGDLLKQIRESLKTAEGRKIPIYVDPIGLREAEMILTAPVVIDLEDVPLKFSLRLMLKQLGLAYCVRDGVLIISSLEGIEQELLEAQRELIAVDPDRFSVDPDGSLRLREGMAGPVGGMR